MGTIRLLACRYLIVITDAEICGTIAGHNIYKITSTEILPYTRSSLHLSEKQVQNNATYVEMIKSVLNTSHFYFSYSYDLSHTMQRLHNTTPEFLQVSGIFLFVTISWNIARIRSMKSLFRCHFMIGQIPGLYGMHTCYRI